VSKWEIFRLGNIGKIVTGNTPPTKNHEFYSSEDISFYKPADLTETEVSYLNRAETYVSELARPFIRLLPKGSVLVSCIGMKIGKVGVALEECTCNQQINAIIPDIDKADSGYLAYCVKSRKEYLENIANAPVLPIINKSQFSNVEIPLPPLETQRQIAKTLDTAAELLAMRKQQLAELDNLIKSVFYDMFGDPVTNPQKWKLVRLGDIGELNSGGTPTRTNREYFLGDIDWYSAGELNERYLKGSKEKLTEEAISNSAAKVFKKGSMLIGMYDTAAFKLGILTDNSSSNQACANVDVKKDMANIEWLYDCAQIMREYFLKNRRGVRQKNLNLGMIRSFEIPLPPLMLQTHFAEIVTKIEEQKSLVKKAIDETQYLFDSLMSEYFD
jgi:type I restriction enzyme S subunit